MRCTARADPSTLACCRHDVAPGYTSRQYPVTRQEWAEALSAVLAPEARRAVLAPEAGRAVLAPDARRAVRMGRAIRLVRGLLDANALVGRLDRLLGPGVHLGTVEEHGRRILELVISNEIANLELEITL